MTKRERIIAVAKEALEAKPEGLRHAEMCRIMREKLPDIPQTTIAPTVSDLDKLAPNDISKVARGFFRLRRIVEADVVAPPSGGQAQEAIELRESDFYESFADWLVYDVGECTKAIPLGGATFRDKWGTPDVVGVREPARSSIIKPPSELVAAEIKLDPNSLIVAFGQACSYRVFAHKSYIVIPSSSSEDDKSRIDALSRIIGIGLILFDARLPQDPKFEIRARALRGEPDMFYVDKYLRLIEDVLFS